MSLERDFGQFNGRGPDRAAAGRVARRRRPDARPASRSATSSSPPAATTFLAPPDIPIGVVRNVIRRSSAEGPLLEIEPSADLDRLHYVDIIVYRPPSESGDTTPQQAAGRRLMLASLVQGPLLRLFLVGVVLLALQTTLFADLRPAGVSLQVVLALAAAAGAAGGPQKGALAGFVLGLLYDLHVGTPLGSSSISMGVGGFVAGYVTAITIRPAVVAGRRCSAPSARRWARRPCRWSGRSSARTTRSGCTTASPSRVVAAGALVLSPLFVPVGRWCMRVKEPEWKAPREEV